MLYSKLLKTTVLLGCLAMAGTANAAHFLYTGGHDLDTTELSANQDTFTQFTPDDAGWAAALGGTYGSFDAIIAGEAQGYTSISASTQAAIANYVSNGGQVIVVNDHNGNINFYNSVFGYSATVNYGCNSDDSVAGTKTAAATGRLAAGPAQLHNASCTAALNTASLPAGATPLYANTVLGTSVAVKTTYGSGQVEWLGWDYCCGAPSSDHDWYTVLDLVLPPDFTTCAAEGYFGARRVLCRNICEIPQSPARLKGLIKVYNAIYKQPLTCPAAQPAVTSPPPPVFPGF